MQHSLMKRRLEWLLMTKPCADEYARLLTLAEELRRTSPRGRYAPSPTGQLHLGNVRTALLAWLQIRLTDGVFVLRIEDLDQPRTRPGSTEQIIDDLRWLGLDWDEGPDCGGPLGPYHQSARHGIYAEAMHQLEEMGRVFPCFCSRKDIAQAASAPHAGDEIATYPGTCRDLSPDQRQARQALRPERSPAWRFRADAQVLCFDDVIAGKQAQDLRHEAGDFVLRRADTLFAYQLAVVVDDWLMGMTDVVRGADLLSSTPRQLALFAALGAGWTPNFWHVPLLHDANGKRLSKRDGSDSLAILRARGDAPARVVGQLAESLHLVPAGSRLSAPELLQELTMERFRNALTQTIEAGSAKADTGDSPDSSATDAA